jgi:signal transduction histidine kinase
VRFGPVVRPLLKLAQMTSLSLIVSIPLLTAGAMQYGAHGVPAGLSPDAHRLFVAADVITALSYFAIAGTIMLLVARLRDQLPFQIVFVLFGAFIVLCGATHIMGVLPLGENRGVVETGTMVSTAVVSLLTAIILPFMLPRVETLVRDAAMSRQREREQARADALAESNELLVAQARDLQRVNDALAASLKERERLEGHLQQVQKMEVLGRLASGVAHDFNNLLTVIQGNLELARDEAKESAADATYLDEIGQATHQAAELTHRLLAFGRRAPTQTSRTTLNQLLAAERRLLERVLPANIRLELRTGEADGLVEVDVGQMQQAILNLIINARDATASAGRINGTVTVETGVCVVHEDALPTFPPVGPGTYMTVAVADEGTGMSQETREKCFDPFFTTKDDGKGTGLGLSMLYDVMAKSGGGVHVDTEIGRGTTFTLLLPKVA